MANLQLEAVNHSSSNLLSLTSPCGLDVVGRPAIADGSVKAYRFEAPMTKVSIKTQKFTRARVTLTWPTEPSLEWDQAGLILVRPDPALPRPSSVSPGDASMAPSFVKICLETVGPRTLCAANSCQRGQLPDWSLWPTPHGFEEHHRATFELIRHGALLLVFLLEGDSLEQTCLFRVIPWVFDIAEDDDSELWVGLFVARPDLKGVGGSALNVQFHDFVVASTEDYSEFP